MLACGGRKRRRGEGKEEEKSEMRRDDRRNCGLLGRSSERAGFRFCPLS